ncbi:hypothetical protein JHN61_19885 [Streptomyces sp. MBT67]|uniref:NACHT domain-containing protein n=1 Tax=unclassified Streptomyces TaxID=2593676 RepID=UPI00190C21D9|nr:MULTISPECIES: hypothetical protein [unclassified Streptomyces]MBK3531470.1 hypothetical protein [Streptomyces sp. MBT72]MBK3538450.1 hypothetical protein [Streptomyces sp. MBT67]MBK3551653.1 hypothetical protein [Streptomyces sp. MBT61]MBK6031427.1 hypothetical protein [Streptomyces sp. MBT59]
MTELDETVDRLSSRQPRYAQTVLPVVPVECVTFEFGPAVEALVGGREGFTGLAERILEPLRLAGGEPVELGRLFGGFETRVRSCQGQSRTALLCAADVVLLVAAFCDAVARLGAVRDADAAGTNIDLVAQVLEELGRVEPGSARARGAVELREEIASAYAAAADVMRYGGYVGASPGDLARRAQHRFRALLGEVTWSCPEFRLTSETDDPDHEQKRAQATHDRVGLVELGVLLREFASGAPATPQQRERLRSPIAPAEGSGAAIPTLASGYVNPAFRVARHWVDRQLASDDWWEGRPQEEDIAGFLAAHLLGYQATQAPLVVLGHPGSGKSLLARLIAARLPEAEFSCLHAELRHIPAELDLQEQLEEALFLSTGRRVLWPDAFPADETVRVVLLDGLDELIQAGADRLDMSRQWRYLKNIEQFQQREFEQGRPVVFVVTSRTVVADQVLTPANSTVLRLDPFDDERIACWLDVWNATNRRYYAAQGVQPLTWESVRPYRELARHSLLLLMLALYDAAGNRLQRLDGRDIRRVDLYERLLVEFVRRQVVKREGPLPPAEESDAIENELRRLGVVAVGMFNRRSQSLTVEEAARDLNVLLAEEGSMLLFGRFFFVHEAQAVVADERRRSYEFLHATFGEYLVARLVCDEVRRVLARHDWDSGGPFLDEVLQAVLSGVPLTDRAEVLENIRDLAGADGPRWHSGMGALLRTLFGRTDGGSGRPEVLPYAPVGGSRTERDAVYGANLLLLILLVEGRVGASELLAADAPVERWWRRAQFWRSQFGEASWELFAKAVSVEQRFADRDPGDGKDLWIQFRSFGRLSDDLAWTLRRTVRGPASYHDVRGVDAADLMRRLSLLCDTDTQQLLHALGPLLHMLPNTLRTYRVNEEQRVLSGAHALIGLVCHNRELPEQLAVLYHDALEVMRHLPDGDRSLFADVLMRQLVHDADLLPEHLADAVLNELIRIGPTGGAPRRAALWPVLEAHLLREMAAVPEGEPEFEVLVGRLRRYAALFRDPRERLPQLLREAGTSRIWAAADHGRGNAVLEEAHGLLEAVGGAGSSPATVIGLLRLACELGAEDWLAEHAEPLLQGLEPAVLLTLRATDADALRPVVGDPRILKALRTVEGVWRGPAPPSRVRDSR